MAEASALESDVANGRQFARFDVRSRARIRIGRREYAGRIENISSGGARIVTLTQIRELGSVQLTLPDLPPVWGRIRWLEPHGAGVRFEMALSEQTITAWVQSRARV